MPGQIVDACTEKERTLCDWFTRHGGRLGPLGFASRNGVRGMVATRDIAEGEELMWVPRSLFITWEMSLETPTLKALGLSWQNGSHASLGLFLLHARRHDKFWHPVLDTYPTSYDTRPEYYGPADWALLNGTTAQARARRNAKHALSQYRRICNRLPEGESLAQDEFLWAYCTVSTRCFKLMLDGEATTGMVPLADMLNHAVRPVCDWYGDHSSGMALIAQRALKRGEEVTVSYGNASNIKLLTQYGFSEEHNPDDSAGLSFTLGKDHWLHERAPELTEGDVEQEFEIGMAPTNKHAKKLLSFLRLSSLPDAQAMAACHRPEGEEDLLAVPMMNVDNERSVLQRLIETCEARLAGFDSPLEDDNRLLAFAKLTGHQRNAVVARRAEHRMLMHTVNMARRALAALALPHGAREVALRVHARQDCPWRDYFESLARVCDRE